MWWNKKKQLSINELDLQLSSIHKAIKIIADLRIPLSNNGQHAYWNFLYHSGLYLNAQAEDIFDKIYRTKNIESLQGMEK